VRHFEAIERAHMRGLPIINPKLCVEAVGAWQLADHRICILIAPWFMNLVLLPGNDDWAGLAQGQVCDVELPRETLQFTVCHDDVMGTFLTAVMFRTVSDFPDQDTARGVAAEILQQLFSPVAARPAAISRRALFTGSGAADA
jgi:[NiFe] hydrogenase assembly HybE family chaperone